MSFICSCAHVWLTRLIYLHYFVVSLKILPLNLNESKREMWWFMVIFFLLVYIFKKKNSTFCANPVLLIPVFLFLLLSMFACPWFWLFLFFWFFFFLLFYIFSFFWLSVLLIMYFLRPSLFSVMCFCAGFFCCCWFSLGHRLFVFFLLRFACNKNFFCLFVDVLFFVLVNLFKFIFLSCQFVSLKPFELSVNMPSKQHKITPKKRKTTIKMR